MINVFLRSLGVYLLGVISKNQQPGDISRPSSARMKLAIEEGENAYWYMVYPFQCVLAAEEVIWTSHLRNAVEKRGFESMTDVRYLKISHLSSYRPGHLFWNMNCCAA